MSQTFEDDRTSAATPLPEREPPRRGALRRFINRLEVDQATFYSLCLRGWQLLAGPVSIVMIGTFFGPEVQGYYYTFAYLMAMQSFFELGLHIVIINVSSHEWSRLGLDAAGRIRGDADALSRLVSLGRWLFIWYAAVAVAFASGVGSGGGWFLARKDYGPIPWQSPWTALVILSAIMLWQLPFVVLLEGCGQMPVVNRYRVYQAVTGSFVVWSCMALGAGLWSAVAAAAVQVFWNSGLILVRFGRFFSAFWKKPTGPRMVWQTELWPMQWRLAISAAVSYFAFSLFVPVMFNYHGPAVAGQMGMTWQLTTVLQAVALAWVQARAPLFGQLIAKRDYQELDRVYFRLTQISLLVVTAGALALGLAVWGLYASPLRLAHRLLEPFPTALLLLGILCYHVPNCQALYIRAHKRDPLFPLSVAASLLIGLSVWWFGSRHGPTGAATAYLVIVAGFVLPWQSWIWYQCRRSH
jgi:O-antigen/teichoic acid export membrane protein